MLTKFQTMTDGLHAEIFSDTVTKAKIHQHLLNPFDTISEQDIINIKTEMSVTAVLDNFTGDA